MLLADCARCSSLRGGIFKQLDILQVRRFNLLLREVSRQYTCRQVPFLLCEMTHMFNTPTHNTHTSKSKKHLSGLKYQSGNGVDGCHENPGKWHKIYLERSVSYTLLSSFCAQMGSTDAVTFFIFQKRGDLGFWYIYYTRLDSWDMLISRSSIIWMDTIFAVVLLRYGKFEWVYYYYY